MSRAPILILVVLLAVIVGVVVTQFFGEPGDSRQNFEGRPQLTAAGRTSAFYLELSPEDRLSIAKSCLARLTAGQAAELGTVKDDLALLADDPAVHQLILDACATRAQLTRFEASGFCDIFAIVKHPDFVIPTARLLAHSDLGVRQKAVMAAIIQADPSLLPLVDRVYADFDVQHPGEGLNTRLSFVEAARRCGGDHAPMVFARALKDSNAEVRATAADNVASLGLKNMADRILPLLSDSEGGVSLKAAWALTRLGRREGEALLLKGLEPSQPVYATTCAEAIIDNKLTSAIAPLKAHLDAASVDLRPTFLSALVQLGDAETLQLARDNLTRTDATLAERLNAITALGRLLAPEDMPALKRIAESPDVVLTTTLTNALSTSPRLPELQLVQAILRGKTLTHPGQIATLATRLSDRLVPDLAAALDAAETEIEAAVAIGGLGSVGTLAARTALLERRARHRALVDQQLRLVDLELRKRGGAA